MAAACEGAVEETRQDSGAWESEEDGGPAVPPRAAQELGERLLTGENRPVRQNEVHRLEACGLGDRGESRTGSRGTAGEIFEGVRDHGVAPDPVGGRAAHRAIRVVDQDDGACFHLPIVIRERIVPFRGYFPPIIPSMCFRCDAWRSVSSFECSREAARNAAASSFDFRASIFASSARSFAIVPRISSM